MRVIYELPRSYAGFVRQQWDEVMAEHGLAHLDIRLIDTFKLAYQDLLNDVVRVAIFDSNVPTHINRVMLDNLVATAMESFSEEECEELVRNAVEHVHDGIDEKHIMTVMSDIANTFDNDDDPDNYFEIHMLATKLIVNTFEIILDQIGISMDAAKTFAVDVREDGLKRASEILDSGNRGVTVSPDYSYVIVEVGEF